MILIIRIIFGLFLIRKDDAFVFLKVLALSITVVLFKIFARSLL